MTTEKQLVYLACPYSDPDSEIMRRRFRSANVAAAWLMANGNLVLSPISHSHPIACAGGLPRDFAYWEAYDRALLACCRKMVVLMLDGWKESVGVQAEIKIAEEMLMPIEYMEP